ncbi:hypothetical protein [Stutzerimonas azotifigens]|uniref:hypothetical protein n=1 Tax=Stutzerimonas azotifigens TaxID=291995 RepID=UPI00041FB37D|nr:hypothetical protein [Stutzerimonas azotifigens]
MRNDTDDELENVPSLSAGRDRDEPYPAPNLETVQPQVSRAYRQSSRSGQGRRSFGTAPLWAMVIALLVALGGLGWWSFQQISLLEMQLVATQDAFARISEDANGRLQDISGKVVAAESNVTTESEAVKLRIKQLEGQVAELTRQQRAVSTQQESLTGRQGNHDKQIEGQDARLQAFAGDLGEQQAALAKLAEAVKTLGSQQAQLESSLQAQAKLGARIETLEERIAALQKQGNPSQAIARLEQDLLVLRSEVDNRPAPTPAPASAPGVNTAEFDAFRAQMTRNISTLQSQIANLQGQLNAR